MFFIIQWQNDWNKFKVLPSLYNTWKDASLAKKRIFQENNGQKSGWYTIHKLDKFYYVSQSEYAHNN